VAEPKLDAPPAPGLMPATALNLVPKLRWANIGWHYHWGTKQYDFARGPISVDVELQKLCKNVVKAVEWKEVFEVGQKWDGESWEKWEEDYGRHKTKFMI
jgi:alkylated DNA repair protein alkB family protein 1